jgi:hypothetical protein
MAGRVRVPAAICLTASPRSQQELRPNSPPTRAGVNASYLHVSRSLWLIVALVAPSVKSARRRRPIFRQTTQLVTDRGFLSLCESRQWGGGPGLSTRGHYQRTVGASDSDGGNRALRTAPDQPRHAPRSHATAPAGRLAHRWRRPGPLHHERSTGRRGSGGQDRGRPTSTSTAACAGSPTMTR